MSTSTSTACLAIGNPYLDLLPDPACVRTPLPTILISHIIPIALHRRTTVVPPQAVLTYLLYQYIRRHDLLTHTACQSTCLRKMHRCSHACIYVHEYEVQSGQVCVCDSRMDNKCDNTKSSASENI